MLLIGQGRVAVDICRSWVLSSLCLKSVWTKLMQPGVLYRTLRSFFRQVQQSSAEQHFLKHDWRTLFHCCPISYNVGFQICIAVLAHDQSSPPCRNTQGQNLMTTAPWCGHCGTRRARLGRSVNGKNEKKTLVLFLAKHAAVVFEN